MLAFPETTESEKKELMPLVQNLVAMSFLARRFGLLALEDYADDRSVQMPFLLRKGLQLLVDGYEFDDIARIFDNYIESGAFVGKELLERLIIREAVRLIQDGTNPRLMCETMVSFFGESFVNFELDVEDLHTAAQKCVIFSKTPKDAMQNIDNEMNDNKNNLFLIMGFGEENDHDF